MGARSSKPIPKVMELLLVANRYVPKPGFDHVLQFTHSLVDPTKLSYRSSPEKELSYRVRVDPSLCLQDNRNLSLGTFMAMMDNLTTYAIVASNSKSMSPGVSIQLQAECTEHWGKTIDNTIPFEVDIVSQVVKLGSSISVCRSVLYDAESRQRLGMGSHIKYMPPASLFLRLATSNVGWPLLLACSKVLQSKVSSDRFSLDEVILPHLKLAESGTATFQSQSCHMNAFGSVHGGCQAILMEIVGESLAKERLRSDHVVLESMRIEYLSAGRGEMNVLVVDAPEDSSWMRIQLQRPNGRIVSEGTLRWRVGDSNVQPPQ